jgi:hypothetical protein
VDEYWALGVQVLSYCIGDLDVEFDSLSIDDQEAFEGLQVHAAAAHP